MSNIDPVALKDIIIMTCYGIAIIILTIKL